MLQFKTMIGDMVMLQMTFNTNSSGEEWILNKTKEGGIIDWPLCISQECSELIDSIPWKHWKNLNAVVDYNNLLIELVDIWHFVISHSLSLYTKSSGNLHNISEDIISSIIDKATVLADTNKYTAIAPINTDKVSYNRIIINNTKNLIQTVLQPIENNTQQDKYIAHADNVMESFFKLLMTVDAYAAAFNLKRIGLKELYLLYIGKNALNNVRQINGYKTGEYNKLWLNSNGELVEDNIILQELLDSNKIQPVNFYTVTKAMDDYYKTHFTKNDN